MPFKFNKLSKLNKPKSFTSLNVRIFVILTIFFILFFALISKLYFLQIKNGELLTSYVTGTISKKVTIAAPRGNIYDKFGRKLAVNNSSFTVNIDPSISLDDDELNEVILKTMNLLEENGESIVDDFPISEEKPYTFLFGGSESLEKTWKNDMNLEKNSLNLEIEDITAEQAFYLLREKFEIPEELSDEDARKILIVRSALYKQRYSKFLTVTLAYNVSKKTIGTIEENASDFISISIDVEATREYPKGELFSHVLGYIRAINSDELEEYHEQGYTEYTANDIVGKDGIEKAFETTLKGTDGVAYYEVDTMGRKIKENTELTVDPIAGNDVFLTSDANLTEVAFNALEYELAQTIKSRLLGENKNINYTPKDILSAMVSSDNISMQQILASEEDSYQYILKNYILKQDESASEDLDLAREILSSGISSGSVSLKNVAMSMFEQGIITGTDDYKKSIANGSTSVLQLLIDKLDDGEITPQMTGFPEAPATGSVFVTDIQTGAVLASVSYPSYDNNRLVNTFDNAYYTKINNDPTSPLVNRPLTEPRAPGSIFKMIVAVAALETGIITPTTTVYDKGTFTDAGRPYARCWINDGNGSHGSINVSEALEVSCNYFFYDTSFKMGIEILNDYMTQFGLDDSTGVEIYELYDYSSLKQYPSRISSPAYKEYITKLRNPDATESDTKWTAGDTIRTAIGQSYNNYTAATMTKYIATLANGGKRYALHFLNKITNSSGDILEEYEPILEHTIEIKEENLEAIKEGMYLVTSGSRGTLRNEFKDFPIKVAAKSGTAQESSTKNNHNIFTCFAPYDDPQIAITIIIPYGDDTYSPAAKVAKKIMTEYFSLDKEPEKMYTNTLTVQ